MVNPFPLSRQRGVGRADAHHNPMEPLGGHRSGRYRPKLVTRAPRCIPDERFDESFVQLGSHRDRALVALWVSTGARASELLGATVADVDPGQQLITVIRKGTRALQPLPAAPDAFVWLRLYQAQLAGLVAAGRDEPLWWTLRRPLRPLRYDAARAMFTRANAGLGSNWSLHDLRHTPPNSKRSPANTSPSATAKRSSPTPPPDPKPTAAQHDPAPPGCLRPAHSPSDFRVRPSYLVYFETIRWSSTPTVAYPSRPWCR